MFAYGTWGTSWGTSWANSWGLAVVIPAGGTSKRRRKRKYSDIHDPVVPPMPEAVIARPSVRQILKAMDDEDDDIILKAVLRLYH